jgi:hypothetical protein
MNQNLMSCPACGSDKCLWGKLELSDPDAYFSGHFYPSYIRKASLFSFSNPGVPIADDEKIYACYSCGHLWSRLNLEKYKSVLERSKWKGGVQVVPRPRKPYFSWVSSAIIGALLLFILFLNFNT